MLKSLIACMMFMGTMDMACGQDAWDIARTTIGGKRVAIEYGRPSLKGRSLDILMKQLPENRIWRAGSGPVTVLSTETDLVAGGKTIPAGDYSLYMYCPEKGDFALIINRDLSDFSGQPLPKAAPARANRPYPHFMDYETIAGKEVARVPLKQVALPRSEVLIYSFEPVGQGTLLTIHWGDRAWTVEFQIH